MLERERTIMRLRSCWIIALLIHGLWTNSVFAVGNVEAGKQKSTTCVTCHNVDGNSTTTVWPKIAGQYDNYLVKQLRDFKSGARANPQMIPFMANLNDQDIQDLAAYFSSQQQTPAKAVANYVKLGEKIYRGGNLQTGVPACTACHGPTGGGNLLSEISEDQWPTCRLYRSPIKSF